MCVARDPTRASNMLYDHWGISLASKHIFVCVCGGGNGNQGLVHVRQTLYHWDAQNPVLDGEHFFLLIIFYPVAELVIWIQRCAATCYQLSSAKIVCLLLISRTVGYSLKLVTMGIFILEKLDPENASNVPAHYAF